MFSWYIELASITIYNVCFPGSHSASKCVYCYLVLVRYYESAEWQVRSKVGSK